MSIPAPIKVTCSVVSNEPLTQSVFELGLSIDPRVEFVAGQYIGLVIPGLGTGGKDLRRPYSIASSPSELPRISLCIKLVPGGPGTGFLKRKIAGDTIQAFLPYGSFTFKTGAERKAVFVSTGTGISPFRSMLRSLSKPPEGLTVLEGVSTEDEILYDSEMKNYSGITWVPCVSRSSNTWKGFKGRVTDFLRQSGKIDWKNSDFYLCGNGAMIQEVKAILADQSVPKEQVFQEIYYKPPTPRA